MRSSAHLGPRWADQAHELPGRQEHLHPEEPSQHAERSRVTPYYVWGTAALLVIGCAAGVVYWQMQHSVEETASAVPVLPDPLIRLDDGTKSVLLDPTPELAAQLKRSFLGKPDQLCAELKALGLENRGWRKAPFQRERWQCASDLVQLTTPSVDFGPATLFFLAERPRRRQDRLSASEAGCRRHPPEGNRTGSRAAGHRCLGWPIRVDCAPGVSAGDLRFQTT